MIFLSDFHILRPKFEIEQKAILEWVAKAHLYSEQRSGGSPPNLLSQRLLKIGLGENKIKKRGICLPDILHTEWSQMLIYNLDKTPQGYGFKERTHLFDQLVTEIFQNFYAKEAPLPSHLIHVTCTGYSAPSGAQKIVSSRKGRAQTTVTHAYHMGCCAAMPAIRMAKGFSREGNSVDIVHTELCSLHMNPLAHDNEQLVVQTLFGDGFIKYSVGEEKKGLEVLALHEEIVPHSLDDIGWECHEWGLAMKLSKEVPHVIAQYLSSFLQNLAKKADLAFEKFADKSFFAIHPGGVKIIEEISKLLSLKPWQTHHSRSIMQNFGNMSSATQPHIWEKMLQDPEVPANVPIFSFAFGPGITISGGIFKKCGC